MTFHKPIPDLVTGITFGPFSGRLSNIFNTYGVANVAIRGFSAEEVKHIRGKLASLESYYGPGVDGDGGIIDFKVNDKIRTHGLYIRKVTKQSPLVQYSKKYDLLVLSIQDSGGDALQVDEKISIGTSLGLALGQNFPFGNYTDARALNSSTWMSGNLDPSSVHRAGHYTATDRAALEFMGHMRPSSWGTLPLRSGSWPDTLLST